VGIEGEQLVFDYLSRVGDLAHGTSMSASDRAALVNRLRNEIGQRRAQAGGAESRNDVKRILGRLGRPEDVVAAAADAPADPAPVAPPPAAPAPPVPGQRRTAGPKVPLRKPGDPGDARNARDAPDLDEAWPDGQIGGFVGGIEIPELLRPPKGEPDGDSDAEQTEELGEPDDLADQDPPVEAAPPGEPARRRWRPRVRRAAPGTRRVGGPFELLAALLLAAGAVIGSIYPLGLGWLVAYWSPRLSRREAQWATFGMPALVAGAYAAWLASRANDAGTEGAVEDALADHWPWLLRGAALASAAFLVWRARRPRPAPAADG
jgi:hypothetical protein